MTMQSSQLAVSSSQSAAPRPDRIFIQPGREKHATQKEREAALCLLFTELSHCLKNGCRVNIDDPRHIIVERPR